MSNIQWVKIYKEGGKPTSIQDITKHQLKAKTTKQVNQLPSSLPVSTRLTCFSREQKTTLIKPAHNNQDIAKNSLQTSKMQFFTITSAAAALFVAVGVANPIANPNPAPVQARAAVRGIEAREALDHVRRAKLETIITSCAFICSNLGPTAAPTPTAIPEPLAPSTATKRLQHGELSGIGVRECEMAG